MTQSSEGTSQPCSDLQQGWAQTKNVQSLFLLPVSRGQTRTSPLVWPLLSPLQGWDPKIKVWNLLNQSLMIAEPCRWSYSWALAAGMRMLVMMMTIMTPLKLMNFKILRLGRDIWASGLIPTSQCIKMGRRAGLGGSNRDGELGAAARPCLHCLARAAQNMIDQS